MVRYGPEGRRGVTRPRSPPALFIHQRFTFKARFDFDNFECISYFPFKNTGGLGLPDMWTTVPAAPGVDRRSGFPVRGVLWRADPESGAALTAVTSAHGAVRGSLLSPSPRSVGFSDSRRWLS